MDATPRSVADALNTLIDDYRSQCLWFLRADYYPATREAQLRVLGYVERHGDRSAHVRAATIRQWLLHDSSAGSAAC